jgi:putative alpha-1,2-mannosidase
MIELMGGSETFEERLNVTFEPGANSGSTIFDSTNEPYAHLSFYLFLQV